MAMPVGRPPASRHERRPRRSASIWAGRRCWSASSTGPRSLCESREASTGQSEDELVELLVREVERGARSAPGRRPPSGSASRRRSTTTAASPSPRSTCRSTTCRSATSSASGSGCRSSSTTTPTSRRSPSTSSAPRGAAATSVMLTIGTGIGGGLILGGEVYRGATGAGAELGHIVIQMDGPPCQGNCPNHGCVEALASGTALGPRGPRGRRKRARLGPGQAAGRRARRSTAGRSPRRRWPATRPRSASST